MASELEVAFHDAMLDIYHAAKRETNYNATRFLHMVGQQGGLATAQSLLASEAVSEGYTELFIRKRLDLTVEALVIQNEWSELFTDAELNIARSRLNEYGFLTD